MAAAAGAAQAQDRERVQSGQAIWIEKANCQTCHGWAADGRKMDSQMPDGANLRVMDLPRETIIEVIRCGRPGTGMPAFERNAYSDGRCYGMRLADLRRDGLMMPDPVATLQPREIEAVVDFLDAKIIGKGELTYERCVEFWEKPVEACEGLERGG